MPAVHNTFNVQRHLISRRTLRFSALRRCTNGTCDDGRLTVIRLENCRASVELP